MKAFADLRIVEVAGSAAGGYAAKLFADYGANVVRVEPPGGDPAMSDGEEWQGSGTTYAYLNTSKRVVTLDLDGSAGRQRFDAMLAGADVVIESSSPDPLVTVTDGEPPSQLVRTRISPFGSDGPYADYRSNEFTDDAIGGHLYVNGEPSREPIRRPGLHALYQAGLHGYIASIAALRARDRTGRGQVVETSHFEGLASLHQHTTTMWTHGGHIVRREGNRQPGRWHPVGCYPCKDGSVHLALAGAVKLADFLRAAGLDALVDDPRFATDEQRGMHKDEFDAALLPWLMEHTVDEIVELGQSVFAPVGPVPGMLEVLADPHLAEREFWRTIEGERPLLVPRGPYQISSHDAHPEPPRHVDEAPAWDEPAEAAAPPTSRIGESMDDGPLTGVRVLDMTRVWAGPLAGRLLGDLGADVVLIEAPWSRGPAEVPPEAAGVLHLYPEDDIGEQPWNRVGGFNKLARNRRSVALDMRTEAGRKVFADLVREADVVMENYSPRVMPQFGFDFDGLRAINPSIVYVAMPGYGSSGPYRDRTALGPVIEAASGLSASMGYAGSGPYRSGIAWPDPVAGLHAAAAVLTALADREADPQHAGRAVEVAMIEAMICFVGEALLAAQVRGSDPVPVGNRDPRRVPQGCYPCAGDDRWIAISVTSDVEWAALCALAGLDRPDDGAGGLAALTHEQRVERHDEIDARIAEWTRSSPPHALMERLQRAGVSAVAVADARDIVDDPQLAARSFWAELDHPDVGLRRYPGNAIRLSETPITYRRSAPLLGEHNREVLSNWLGYSSDRCDELERDGVIADRPPSIG
ncbi:MAG TPA: CoA transferase [Dehalococcoidia bacterium]|nr:CoA transferase [Dehalococcoidia bacterium]